MHHLKKGTLVFCSHHRKYTGSVLIQITRDFYITEDSDCNAVQHLVDHSNVVESLGTKFNLQNDMERLSKEWSAPDRERLIYTSIPLLCAFLEPGSDEFLTI